MPADLAVLGPGRLALPAARAATAAGIQTVAVIPEPRAAAGLNAGRPPAGGPLTAPELRRMLAAGFSATSDPAALWRVRTALVCAPGAEDAREAAWVLGPRLRPGSLVVLQSPGEPGLTRQVLLPLLEEASGLRAGRGFHLACALERPERGTPSARAARVIGGLTPACTEAAAAFYARLADGRAAGRRATGDKVIRARGIAEAETLAALEANLRHVTTALVNETAMLCHDLGIDLWDVLRCAEARLTGAAAALRPGPAPADAAGPVNPGGRLTLVGRAKSINARMPGYVTDRAAALLNEHGKSARGARVLLLGVSGHDGAPGEPDPAAAEIAAGLRQLGADLGFHDPRLPRWQVAGRPVARAASPYEAAADADLTLLLAPHSVYDLQGLAAKAQLLFDTRGVTPAGTAHRL
ncbi:UDP binding domain-containing protein [Streptomyces sp. 7-21]|uniref:UDP binding domain-containing protein n=1 Tax=Streptomyces sp. 7-21 TaxID=2802283 RepID=UPI00191D0621|nr:UDP binding domain-containing protein [Streptomyces sp. 7-21]MBL1065669.1 nucleotide sugar dehydrogenase [Streptomyces sp. 7-21]